MGRVTNIYFEDGLKMDDVSICKGISTQVRHDLGCGTIHINGNGKITYTNFYGNYEGRDIEEQYDEEMKNLTGVLDSDIGYLFFFDGQIQHLDISAALTACTGTPMLIYLIKDIDILPAHPKLTNLQGSMDKVEYSILCGRIEDIRKRDPSVPIEVLEEYEDRRLIIK